MIVKKFTGVNARVRTVPLPASPIFDPEIRPKGAARDSPAKLLRRSFGALAKAEVLYGGQVAGRPVQQEWGRRLDGGMLAAQVDWHQKAHRFNKL